MKRPKNLETFNLERPIFSKKIRERSDRKQAMTVLDWVNLRFTKEDAVHLNNLQITFNTPSLLCKKATTIGEAIKEIHEELKYFDPLFCQILEKTYVINSLQRQTY